ncbi:MAG: c-type cytochrome [Acidobacteria bacterium]|nr:c-type cytochrome [Acidobacteriota bacterium]
MTTPTTLKGVVILAVLVGAAIVASRFDWPGLWPPDARVSTPGGGPPLDRAVAGAATGEELYSTFCSSCHGFEGRGDGVAGGFCRIPPADFTRADFKVRSTPTGSLPSDADLAGVIRRGAGGDGAMPPFDFLEDEDVVRLVARIKAFSPRWQHEQAPPGVVLPPRVEGSVQRGEEVYRAWGCPACHGPTGEGNGPRAADLLNARGLADAPTNLTRPGTFKAGPDDISLIRSVLTGFNGTTMPAYEVPPGGERSVWDLSAYMGSLQVQPDETPAPGVDTSSVAGYWKRPIPAQGGELSAASCAGCHASQFSDWSGTRHSMAMGPGVWAQMNDQPDLSGMCATCHAPLRDQWVDPYLSADGVGCSACHSRARQKFGPPPLPTTIAPLVSRYPAPHGPAATRDFFESVDFCAGCHQFSEGKAEMVHGAFLENTVEEWRGSRAAQEGRTCQTCHMPDRRHLFRGIHDPDTVRAGVRWTFDARRVVGGRVESRMILTNTDTGHAFPTYVVPEVWMRIELIAGGGVSRVVAERLIARRVSFANGQWTQQSDTRLSQDESATLDYSGVLPPGAIAVVGTVVVRPDAFHVESLASRLRDTRSPASRRSYERALAEMRSSDYVLFRMERPLAP